MDPIYSNQTYSKQRHLTVHPHETNLCIQNKQIASKMLQTFDRCFVQLVFNLSNGVNWHTWVQHNTDLFLDIKKYLCTEKWDNAMFD